MKQAYWKIPKEWVTDWGLSHTEAIVLADIQSWPECSHEERAKRVGLSARQLTRVKDKMSSNVRTKCLMELGQNVLRKRTKCPNGLGQNVLKDRTKCPKNLEKKEIPPTPPIKNKKESKKNIEEQYLSDATAPTGKKDEPKVYSLQHRCRLFFEQIYSQKKGAEYWYEGKDAAALKNILKKIRFLMPDDEKDNEEKLEYNFQYFINAICTSPHTSAWVMDNFSLPTINSKFNEIYSQLKNGTAKQYRQQSGITDDQIRSIAERVAANGGLAF